MPYSFFYFLFIRRQDAVFLLPIENVKFDCHHILFLQLLCLPNLESPVTTFYLFFCVFHEAGSQSLDVINITILFVKYVINLMPSEWNKVVKFTSKNFGYMCDFSSRGVIVSHIQLSRGTLEGPHDKSCSPCYRSEKCNLELSPKKLGLSSSQ